MSVQLPCTEPIANLELALAGYRGTARFVELLKFAYLFEEAALVLDDEVR